MSHFVIACGGTGGHLAPGISLAQALTDRGHQCWLVISNKSVDAWLIKKYPQLNLFRISAVPFSFHLLKLVAFVYYQGVSFFASLRFLHKVKPQLVIGFGGFITATLGIAGLVSGYPLVLLEANHYPGKTTRLLASFCRRVYFPNGVTLKRLAPDVVRSYGYPIRREIRSIPKKTARQLLGIDPETKLLVVIGGSQGAVALNDWVREHFCSLGKWGISVYCIYGVSNASHEPLQVQSTEGPVARLYWVPFSDQMHAVLSSADLIVSRSGAGSIAEIIQCRVPTIFVPYPHAADDHQLANARFVEQHGSAMIVEQQHLNRLEQEVVELFSNEWLRDRFRKNLAKLDREDTLDALVNDLESIVTRMQPYGRASV